MDARTLEALQGSIAKWDAIAAGTGKDQGPLNCPLCQLFNRAYRKAVDGGTAVSFGSSSCSGCPVYEATSVSFCTATPYLDYAEIVDVEGPGTPRALRAARLEALFLRSLLPLDGEE